MGNERLWHTLPHAGIFTSLKKAPAARIMKVSSALGSFTINANPENPYRFAFDAAYGTDTVEEGSKEPIRVALAEDLPN